MFESSRERRTLLRTAPHLVRPLRFLWPTYEGARVARWKLRAGFFLYDALSLFRNVAPHRALSADEAIGVEPALRHLGLTGGFVYWDAATDDARLTLVNAIDAARAGALVVNHAAVRHLGAGDPFATVRVEDRLTGRTAAARARVVVNATGPWSDDVRALAGRDGARSVRASRGAHIAVPRERVRNAGAVTILSPIDGRVMFVLPAGKRTIIGTTETPYDGLPEDVRATPDEITYLLRSANAYFPGAHLGAPDVVSAWAGIRPLAASSEADAGKTSREHAITWSTPWLLSVTGGKLTTYREMAAEVVDTAVKRLGRQAHPAGTDRRALPGGDIASLDGTIARAETDVGDRAIAEHLVASYGSEWRDVWSLAAGEPPLAERIEETLPYVMAEVHHAVLREMALTLADVLVRRTHLAFETGDHGIAVAPRVAAEMARILGWSLERVDDERRRYELEVRRIFG